MPQGNWLKGLQTKWRLFQAVLRAGSQPDKAEQSLLEEVGVLQWTGLGAAPSLHSLGALGRPQSTELALHSAALCVIFF